jgi:alkylation response protein AidB-like acyl-CoA dehydrogenase
VELPADDGGLETGARAGGRELRGDQTLGDHPLTALKLAELAKDIFPAGVLNVLFGRGKTWVIR